MSKGARQKRRYCDHCNARLPHDSPPCRERPDLREQQRAVRVSWDEHGKRVSSVIPEKCLKRVPS